MAPLFNSRVVGGKKKAMAGVAPAENSARARTSLQGPPRSPALCPRCPQLTDEEIGVREHPVMLNEYMAISAVSSRACHLKKY